MREEEEEVEEVEEGGDLYLHAPYRTVFNHGRCSTFFMLMHGCRFNRSNLIFYITGVE